MKTTKDLIKYIKVQTKRGVSKNEIINTLKEHKWSDEAIVDGYKKAEEGKGVIIIIILILIIGGSLFYGWKNGLLKKFTNKTIEVENEIIEVIPEKPRMPRVRKEV